MRNGRIHEVMIVESLTHRRFGTKWLLFVAGTLGFPIEDSGLPQLPSDEWSRITPIGSFFGHLSQPIGSTVALQRGSELWTSTPYSGTSKT